MIINLHTSKKTRFKKNLIMIIIIFNVMNMIILILFVYNLEKLKNESGFNHLSNSKIDLSIK